MQSAQHPRAFGAGHCHQVAGLLEREGLRQPGKCGSFYLQGRQAAGLGAEHLHTRQRQRQLAHQLGVQGAATAHQQLRRAGQVPAQVLGASQRRQRRQAGLHINRGHRFKAG